MKRPLAILMAWTILFSTAAYAETTTANALAVSPHYREVHLPRLFDAWTVETDFAQYQIEQKDFQSKGFITQEQAEIAIRQLDGELAALCTYLQYTPEEKPRIAIVTTDTKGRPLAAPYMADGLVVLSPDHLQTGDYQDALLRGFFSDIPAWLAHGVWGIVFDEPTDVAGLVGRLNTLGDPGILGLSALRFISGYSDEADILLAQELATAFTRHLLEDTEPQMLPALSIADVIERKQAWFEQIGVTLPYTGAHEYTLERATYFGSEDRNLLVDFDTLAYRITWYAEPEFRPTIEELEEIIAAGPEERERIVAFILDNTTRPEKIDPNKHITVAVDFKLADQNPQVLGRANSMKATIILYPGGAKRYVMGHELVHALMPPAPLWIAEGVARYINEIAMDNGLMVEAEPFIYFTMRVVAEEAYAQHGFSQERVRIVTWMNEYYANHGGSLASLETFDMVLAWHASAYAEYMKLVQVENNPDAYTIEEDTDPSYFIERIVSFTFYLIDTYSLEKFMDVAMDHTTLADVLGNPFEDLAVDWKQMLLEGYEP